MTPKTKELIVRALQNLRGDDRERAKTQFAGYTDAQLDSQYGHSNRTCREILSEYEAHEKAVNAALAEVAAL